MIKGNGRFAALTPYAGNYVAIAEIGLNSCDRKLIRVFFNYSSKRFSFSQSSTVEMLQLQGTKHFKKFTASVFHEGVIGHAKHESRSV